MIEGPLITASAGASRGARANRRTEAGRRGLAARAARRRQLDPAQARGHGRPDPGRDAATRTSSTWRATCSPATASRPGSCPSTSAPPTGGSSTTSTACSPRRGFPDPVRLPAETLILDQLRAGPRAVAADRRRRLAQRAGLELPARQRRAAQPRQRPPDHPGRLPRRRGRAARSRRTSSACRSSPTSGCCRRRSARRPTLLRLPFTANWPEPVETMVSLLLRPLVCPAVPKVSPEKRMEIRFFVPGGLVSNLDFVESIFGNAGDPYLPANDAGARRGRLDRPQRLRHPRAAPHAAAARRTLGLPHVSRATEAERAAGMCWADEGELYNDGRPFKITSRGHRRRDGHDPGRQLLRVLQEGSEDPDRLQREPVRAGRGGARGRRAGVRHLQPGRPLRAGPGADREREPPVRRGAARCSASGRRFHASGYATDCDLSRDPLHAGGHGDRRPPAGHHLDQRRPGAAPQAPARPDLHPPERLQGPHGQAPRGAELAAVGTVPEGAFCHKPCTVSGGGKSEISKSLVDAVLPGSFYVRQLRRGHGRWSRRSSSATTTTLACPSSARASARRRARSCRPSARSAR